MTRKSLLFTLLLAIFSLGNMTAQDYPPSLLPEGKEPGGKSWADSYDANGFCWCETTFDHELDNINVAWFYINGIKRNIRDICDELKFHPLIRDYQDGDPIYNDVQCGNGPPNNADDEWQCPGRVDEGREHCFKIGPTWDVEWLASRSRFGGNGADQLINNGSYYIESPYLNERLETSSSSNHNGEMDGESSSNEQVWMFVHQGNNVYTIKNEATNRYLEVPAALCENQSNVGTWTSANGDHQKWLIEQNGSNYNLKPLHCTGKSLDRVAGASEANVVIHGSSSTNANQKWDIVSINSSTPPTGEVTILGESIDKYVTLGSGSKYYVTANGTNSYATFTMISHGGDQYSFRGPNGLFLSSEDAREPMTCNRPNDNSWEIFTVEHQGGDVYALKGDNGKYVSHEQGKKAMICDRPDVGSWERFIIQSVSKSGAIPAPKNALSIDNNPVKKHNLFSIRIDVEAASAGTARLYDMRGTLIAKREFEQLDPGMNFITLENFQNTAQQGMYILNFSIKGKTFTKTVIFE